MRSVLRWIFGVRQIELRWVRCETQYDVLVLPGKMSSEIGEALEHVTDCGHNHLVIFTDNPMGVRFDNHSGIMPVGATKKRGVPH